MTIVKAVFMTDKGKVRQNNEDYGGFFTNKQGQYLAIVADGMGGHLAGDVASKMAVDLLHELWENCTGIENAEHAEKWLQSNITHVNKVLYDHAQSHKECEGMGTTIEAVIVTNRFATVAHVGDSRAYLLNHSGFTQLTEDHTFVNELVRTGQISKEDAENHPRKNVILRALGTEEDLKIDLKTIMFEQGDLLLLCSDGLSNKISTEKMLEILQNNETLDQKAKLFIQTANENGGEDNITLIILKFDQDLKEGE